MLSIITRSLLSFFISFGILLCCGNRFIKYLSQKQHGGQPIREDGPQSHIQSKKGTPTMGGILIIFSVILSSLLFSNLNIIYIILSLIILLGFSIVGFLDDYKKVSKHDYHGISAKLRLLLQVIIASICCYIAYKYMDYNSKLYFPFFKDLFIDLGYLFIPWAVFVIIGSSNAVNLTDGLDGLAIGPIITTSISLLIISYLSIEQREICVLLSALTGAGVGFLWFNTYPAKVFMGDTGSLAIGALLGFIAVVLKQEFTYAIIGGIFVIETLSDIIQVLYYKITKRRFFRMAPLHHHFELYHSPNPSALRSSKESLESQSNTDSPQTMQSNTEKQITHTNVQNNKFPESTIVVRFWIVSFIFAIIGLIQFLY